MRPLRFLFLLAALPAACTQDFGVFEPGTDAGAPADASTDGLLADGSAPDAATPDGWAPDASPGDGGGDAAPKDAGGDGGCPGLVYGGHCYFLVGGTQIFDAAKAACLGAGAQLASLTTAQEQTAVQALGAGTERWIGLYRAGGPPSDGSFGWLSGEPRGGFANWAPGNPQGGGQCVSMGGNGEWINEACTNARDAVCER
jgi:hypothetical protein